jgi:hypothetical protein
MNSAQGEKAVYYKSNYLDKDELKQVLLRGEQQLAEDLPQPKEKRLRCMYKGG